MPTKMKSLLFLTVAEALEEVLVILPECDDLRSMPYRGRRNMYAGHCYVVSEVIFHLTGWKYKPMFIRHEGERACYRCYGITVQDAGTLRPRER